MSNLDITLPEVKAKHDTKIYYDYYTNDLCIDVYTEFEDIILSLDMTLAFVECYKVLIDCLNDFGQFYSSDSYTS